MSDELAKWEPFQKGMRYVIARRVFTSWAGSGFVFAREGSRIVRFWRYASAQAYADKLNHGEGNEQ